jgi:mannose-1-phosphate guanylyltransferase/mannose-6-phosphate isomerase
MSRVDRPKQFIPGLVADGQQISLFQQALKRLSLLGQPVEKPIVVCNIEHRFLVTEQLRELGLEATIVLEPIGRNTAPAIAVAALAAKELHGEDSILFVAPSDHMIRDTAALAAAVRMGAASSRKGHLVTFGIVPTRPETGFGYIRANADNGVSAPVEEFVEKPDLVTAQQYIESGSYFWNSGMFMLPTGQFLAELKRFAPNILTACEKDYAHTCITSEFLVLGEKEFVDCPADSIDYAVMEKTRAAMMVPLDAGWCDAGTYAALRELGTQDTDGNIQSGDVVMTNCKGSVVQSESRLVTAVGLEGIAVIETRDAVLVAPVDQANGVKLMVQHLTAKRRKLVETGRKVLRPWGSYDVLETGNQYLVKVLEVVAGGILSLQSHNHRSETWTVVQGSARVTLDDQVLTKTAGESVHIPIGTVHRIENPGLEILKIIEVQMGGLLEEQDIVRYQDSYGRVDAVAS